MIGTPKVEELVEDFFNDRLKNTIMEAAISKNGYTLESLRLGIELLESVFHVALDRVIHEERERCAKIAEAHNQRLANYSETFDTIGMRIAAKIREQDEAKM